MKPFARTKIFREMIAVTVATLATTLVLPQFVLSPAHAAPTPPWLTPQTISTANDLSYDAVSTAITPDGSKQIMFWQSFDSGVLTVKAASANLTGGVTLWGPTSIVATLTDDASRPSIALSWDGTRATAVWRDRSGEADQVIKSASATISGTNQTWGAAETVHTTFNNTAEVPKVALSAGGDLAMVAWYAMDSGQYKIMTRAAGVVGTSQYWQASADVFGPAAPGWNSFVPAIAMNDDATKASVAFYSANPGFTEGAVYARSSTIVPGSSPTYIPTVSWGSAEFLNIPGSGGLAGDVDLALSGDGTKAIASWTNSNSSNVIQINTATISGNTATWSGSGGITVSDPSQYARSSQVAMSNDGTRAGVVWSQQIGADNHVAQVRSATVSGTSSSWDTVTSLSPLSGDARNPDIAMSNSGLLTTAVWAYSSDTTGSDSLRVIQSSNGYDSNGSTAGGMVWSPVATISAATATPLAIPIEGYAGYGGAKPQVALSSDGLIAASAWNWASGTAFSVQSVKANGTCTESWDGSTQCLPGEPTSVNVTAGDSSASFSWTAPTDPYGYGITGYAYELVDTSTSTVVRPLTLTGSTATSMTLSGLTNGATYIAYISTVNNFGFSASDTASSSFTPVAAPAPATPSAPGTSTQSQQPTPTSPGSVTPSATPMVIAGKPDNPVTPEVIAPGFTIVSAAVADNTQPRMVKREPASTLKDAPVLRGTTGEPLSLVTQGLTANTNYSVKVKIDNKYVTLGSTLSDATGLAQLPVFRTSEKGRVTIALINPSTGATTYLKVRFKKGR